MKLTKTIHLQFCDKIRKFSCNFTNFGRKIVGLHCVVSGLVKQSKRLEYLCVKKLLKMANDRRGKNCILEE